MAGVWNGGDRLLSRYFCGAKNDFRYTDTDLAIALRSKRMPSDKRQNGS
jgi:hypothetical protein